MGFYGSDLWALGSYWATFQNSKGPSRKGKKEVLFHKAANCFKNAKSVINMLTMGDEISRGKELVKKAEKKLNGSNYYEAADLLSKAANWGSRWSSICYQLDCKDEAACAYVTAADCYKKIKNSRGGCVLLSCAFCPNLVSAISRLEHAALLFLDIGRLNKARGYYEEIATLYEQENDMEQLKYQRASEMFEEIDSKK
ncbi:hypothetical protein P3S67_008236 [Capsicum chacoense]